MWIQYGGLYQTASECKYRWFGIYTAHFLCGYNQMRFTVLYGGGREALQDKYSRAVRLRQTTDRPELGQKSVFQIYNGLSNLVVFSNQVIIHDADMQVFRYWNVRCQLKHPSQTQNYSTKH